MGWARGVAGPAPHLAHMPGACEDDIMTLKEKVVRAVQGLPDDASIEDAMERLLFLAKIERGLQQADAGQTLSHAEVKEKMAQWLR